MTDTGIEFDAYYGRTLACLTCGAFPYDVFDDDPPLDAWICSQCGSDYLVHLTESGPVHDHDCEACVYLGSTTVSPGERYDNTGEGTIYDLYFHPRQYLDDGTRLNETTLLARWGDAGAYYSGIIFADGRNPLLTEARARAERRGLLAPLTHIQPPLPGVEGVA